jgi:hypothetical protein
MIGGISVDLSGTLEWLLLKRGSSKIISVNLQEGNKDGTLTSSSHAVEEAFSIFGRRRL